MPNGLGGYIPDERVTRLEVQMASNTTELLGVRLSVDRLVSQINGRPSWALLTILSLSTMANGALVTAVVALLSTR